MRIRAGKRTHFPAGGKWRGRVASGEWKSGEWRVAREQWPVASECEEMVLAVIEKRKTKPICSSC